MNPKKKSRRCQALVSIQALDLAISRFIHSLECKGLMRNQFLQKPQKIRLIAMSL